MFLMVPAMQAASRLTMNSRPSEEMRVTCEETSGAAIFEREGGREGGGSMLLVGGK